MRKTETSIKVKGQCIDKWHKHHLRINRKRLKKHGIAAVVVEL